MIETIATLVTRHNEKPADVVASVRRSYDRLAAADDHAVFISVRDQAEVEAEAHSLASKTGQALPLLGILFAVKDNIDVAGLPTTAACPAFSYMPTSDATAVARLRRAGAIVIGKTNLDQFATGLVGVRSPYGVPRNPFDAGLIPGGSSSGSGVAVSKGIVPLALGTDTAGSGRVPAGLNNIVGLKPSLGLVSTAGVVPACRSLDCVSVFALTASDAFCALSAMAAPDELDPFSRKMRLGDFAAPPPGTRIGLPRQQDRIFFGDGRAERAFDRAEQMIRDQGWRIYEINLSPFFDAARLLYEGPWLAERAAAVGEFMALHPDQMHPVTKAVISQGLDPSAVDAFRGLYRLAELRAEAQKVWSRVDALVVPTAPAAYTVAEVEADPIGLNSRLGTYTNFVNLLDLCGFAIPASIADDGTPFGVTFLAPAGHDAALASLGAAFHAATGLPLGASGHGHAPPPSEGAGIKPGEIAIAVVGAHLSGMPLNHELVALDGRFLQATATAPDYRLFALADTQPPKPGLLRVRAGSGAAIRIEIWALPVESFGRFVSDVPPPLGIGSIRLGDGRLVKGFLVEAEGVAGARDVSSFGGWREAVANLSGKG